MNPESPIWKRVDRVEYTRQRSKRGKADSLCIIYHCGHSVHREWQHFESMNGKYRAHTWWKKRTNTPEPKTTTEALANAASLATPLRIQLVKDGKFYKVNDYDFGGRR